MPASEHDDQVEPCDDIRATGYLAVRARVDALLRPATAQAAGLPVRTCPGWTVHDTLAHLVGACADILAGNASTAGSPDWTAAQVTRAAGRSVPDLLDEWSRTGPQVAERLAGRRALGQVLMDAVSHECDLRTALGSPPPPSDDPALLAGLEWLLEAFSRQLDAAERPGLVLRAAGREWRCGAAPVAGAVRAPSERELLRTLTGRRTLHQVRALEWDGDPAGWEPALTWGPFAPAAQQVEPAEG